MLFHRSMGRESDPDKKSPPIFLSIRSSTPFILFTISVAIFTDLFLYGVIVPVIPYALESRAGVSPGSVQHWVSLLLAVYSIALLISSPPLGWLADRVSTRRAPLLGGLLMLAGATLMLMLGRSIGVLIAGRVLQGFSASVVWVAGLAVIADTSGNKDVGRTMGYLALASSLAVLVAPLLGGVVYQACGYYAVFYMCFGLIGLDIILRFAFIEKRVAAQYLTNNQPEIDLDEIRNTDQLSPSNEQHANPAREIAPSKSKLPAIFYLASSRRMVTAFWGSMVLATLFTAFDSTLTLHAKRVFGFDSQSSALLFLAVLIPSLFSPITGKISDKKGPRWLAVSGLVIAMPFLVLLRLVDHNTTGQKVLLCALLVLIGSCVTLSMPPLMSEFMLIVEAKQKAHPDIFGPSGAYAQAYALFNSAWAAGSIVGPLWAGFIEVKAGWGTMTWSLGLLSIVSAIPVAFYTGGYVVRKRRDANSATSRRESGEDPTTTTITTIV